VSQARKPGKARQRGGAPNPYPELAVIAGACRRRTEFLANVRGRRLGYTAGEARFALAAFLTRLWGIRRR
jgi:hypothetical protein